MYKLHDSAGNVTVRLRFVNVYYVLASAFALISAGYEHV